MTHDDLQRPTSAAAGAARPGCGSCMPVCEILVQWIENVWLVDPPKSSRGWILRGWVVLPVD